MRVDGSRACCGKEKVGQGWGLRASRGTGLLSEQSRGYAEREDRGSIIHGEIPPGGY